MPPFLAVAAEALGRHRGGEDVAIAAGLGGDAGMAERAFLGEAVEARTEIEAAFGRADAERTVAGAGICGRRQSCFAGADEADIDGGTARMVRLAGSPARTRPTSTVEPREWFELPAI